MKLALEILEKEIKDRETLLSKEGIGALKIISVSKEIVSLSKVVDCVLEFQKSKETAANRPMTKADKLKKSIENVIADIMVIDGPDRHCDGSNVIADYVAAILRCEKDDWEAEYFKDGGRGFSADESES